MKRSKSVRGILVASVALAAAMCFGAGQAQANHVECGDTITANTTLDSDLINCPDIGIVIGADDITLDLNGHLVDGDGTEFSGCAEDQFCDVGVLNDGHDGVTVKHGSTNQFQVGTFVGRSRHSLVVDISSSENTLFGFVVAESARTLVRDSSGNRNIAPEGDGIGVFRSHHVRILDNSFRNNPGPGIHVEDSTNNLIKGNLFLRNSIFIEADRNQVRGNRSVRNRDLGIIAVGNRNVIARNRVSRAVGGIGIDGRGNLVARNVVVRARRDGIPLFGGANNTVRRNRIRASGDDGIWVGEETDRTLLKRNVAVGAGDDGLKVNNRTTKLTRNRARRNGDLGIDAVQGVIDGGGNLASGNGDPRQCTHIACG